MATSQKLTDHFLTCSVCTCVYSDPCTLTCNHTFCRSCVVSLTRANEEAVKAGCIPCPTCRRWKKVGDPSKPLDRWTDNLKPLFVIQGLLDSFGPHSKDTDSCSWCKHRGETTPAIFWCQVCDDSLCQKCVELHKNVPAISHHNIKPMSPEVKVKRKRKLVCSDHPGEVLEFHCEDCDLIICNKCSITRHRACKSVVDIAAQMEKMKQVLETRKRKIERTRAKKEEQVLERQKEVDGAMTKERGMRSDIISTRDAVVAAVNKKVDLLLDDLGEKTQQQVQDLRSDIKSKNLDIDMCKQDWELVDQGLKSESELEVFQLYKRYRRGTDDIEEDDSPASTHGDIIWKRDAGLLKGIGIGEIALGKIVMPAPDPLTSLTSLDLTSTPVLEETIQVKVAGDSKIPFVYDVVTLDVGDISTVVVTDVNNKSVKSLYSRNTRPTHSKLTLDGSPRCLTVVKENHVAVTIYGSNQITVVEVNPDLKLSANIRTNKQYCGITSLTESTLAVGCRDPPGVDILVMSGHVLKSISPHINNKPVITYPSYICTTGEGNIVVSDSNSKSMVCVSHEGDVVFRYTGPDLQGRPIGVVSTHTGDILVADWDNSNILHLTSTGQFVRKFLTLTGHVNGLHVGSWGRLYVCHNGSDRVVRVYKCDRENNE